MDVRQTAQAGLVNITLSLGFGNVSLGYSCSVKISGRSFTYKRKRIGPMGGRTPVFMGEDTVEFAALTTLSCPV